MGRVRSVAMYAILVAALSVLTFVLIELTLRVWFATVVGPSVLAYGTPFGDSVPHFVNGAGLPFADPESHEANVKFAQGKGTPLAWFADRRFDGYKKYGPNQVRVDRDQRTGERFDVTINRHGFRGLDFEVEKEPGVIRVVTLGSSSTFGYFNRDETTYPVLLEQVLREGCQGGPRYEVINLGIPHLKVAQIRSLFLAEGIALDPDIVTVYSGLNDSPTLRVIRYSHVNAPRGRVEALRARLLSVAFVDSLLDLRGLRVTAAEVERESDQASEKFHAHLSAIHEACESRGILFIALSQQVTSMTIPFDRLAGVTYDEELTRVVDILKSESQPLHDYVFRFLGHSVIMRDLRSWVEKESVPFVDVQAALDSDRDVLLSWVHLSPRGNQLIANAIGEEILTRTCREQPVDASVRQRGGGG